MSVRRSLVIAAAAWLVLSVCTKVARYAHPGEPRQVRTERSVGVFMTGHGLLSAGSRPITTDRNYKALVWRVPGCDRSVTVAALGAGDDLLEAVRGTLGGDVAFLQSGKLSSRPDQAALTLGIMASSAAGWLGARDSTPSILAISPAPVTDGDRCSGPSPKDWSRFALVGP